jgi:hypothetical protein
MGPKGRLARFLLNSGSMDSYISRLHNIVEEHRYRNESSAQVVANVNMLCELLEIYDPLGFSFIRVGNDFDGGYVLVDKLNELEAVLSFGVGTDISFEIELSKSVSMLALYDHTVDELPTRIHNAVFVKTGLSDHSGDNFCTLEEALIQFHPYSNILLKMDIEGAEWAVFRNTREDVLNQFQQIVIEFHGIHKISDPTKAEEMIAALLKINSTHRLVHLHSNNFEPVRIITGVPLPNVIEATYLRMTDSEFSKFGLPRGRRHNRANNSAIPDVSNRLIF